MYLNFNDFDKAFDSVDRSVIWSFSEHCGHPTISIDLIDEFYRRGNLQWETGRGLWNKKNDFW